MTSFLSPMRLGVFDLPKLTTCSVDGCGGSRYAKGFCQKHYGRHYRHGDPLAGRAGTGEVYKFYLEVVLPYEGDECLMWPYASSGDGYGKVRAGGKFCSVSRLLCEEASGPPPTPSHEAAHSCGNGHLGCVTKRHLSWKTKVENEADKMTHGTRPRGASHGMSKLTDEQAREILSLRGREPRVAIAKRFGVDRTTVRNIHSGRGWSHLEERQ